MKKLSVLLALIALTALPLHAAKTNPQVIEGKAPAYPEELKKQGTMGEAKIRARIDEKGAVVEATVHSATHEAFGTAALSAVQAWRFRPAEENGVPVATTVTIPLQFKLSLKEQINAEAGREVFIDPNRITEKIHTWADVKKWFPLRGKDANRIPYPEELKGSGISEEITIVCIISPEGQALNPVIENLQNKQLALPAIRHLALARFQPPQLDGQRIYLQQKIKLFCSEDPEFGKKPAAK